MSWLRAFIVNVGIWITQTLNVWLFAGYADESVSSRCWRLRVHHGWSQLRFVVDLVFGFFGQNNHCQAAYMAELERRQLPPSLRR